MIPETGRTSGASGRQDPARTPGPNEVAAKNIHAIANLEHAALHERSRMDRITDAITNAAGSPAFIIGHAIVFIVWIASNLLREEPWDPYPFSVLTLTVSLEAIFLTGFVLMSQNRMTKQADKRAHLDLQVNLLAEQELTAMLRMLSALCKQAGVPQEVRDVPVEQLLQQTDVHEIAAAIDQELSKAPGPRDVRAPRTQDITPSSTS